MSAAPTLEGQPPVTTQLDEHRIEQAGLSAKLTPILSRDALTPEHINQIGRIIWQFVSDDHGCLRCDLGDEMSVHVRADLWKFYRPCRPFESNDPGGLKIPTLGLILHLPTISIKVFTIGGLVTSKRHARISVTSPSWDLTLERAGAHGSPWEIPGMKRRRF